MTEQARQVRVLADAYGLNPPERARLPDAISERLHRNARLWHYTLHDDRAPRGRRARAADMLAWIRRELVHLDGNQGALIDALSR
jgi:hypothetical protein